MSEIPLLLTPHCMDCKATFHVDLSKYTPARGIPTSSSTSLRLAPVVVVATLPKPGGVIYHPALFPEPVICSSKGLWGLHLMSIDVQPSSPFRPAHPAESTKSISAGIMSRETIPNGTREPPCTSSSHQYKPLP